MKTFKPYNPDQPFLLPPVLQDWLPEDHLAAFLSEVVDAALDLTPILATYETSDGRGQPPYHPALLVKLLLYGYCTGKPSSRQLERATYEEIPYRVLAANQHPDHDTIAAFRQTHLPALAALFVQVLRLCQRAGWCSSATWPSTGPRCSPTPPSTRR
jgi:transposase